MTKKEKITQEKKTSYTKKAKEKRIEKVVNSSAPKTRGFGM